MANNTGEAVAAAAVQGMANMAITAAANKRQYKNQIKAMGQQQAYNKELWDYQNAYNTPQKQMERLQAAGLNPRLIYGSGSANTGNAGEIAPTEVPAREATRGELPNPMDKYLSARQADAQYDATRQNIANQRLNGILTQSKTALENLKVMQQDIRSKNFEDLAKAEKETAGFIRDRTKLLSENEGKKGDLLDQLHTFRGQSNPETLSNQRLENEFKQYRNKLAKMGIYSTDNPMLRTLIQASDRIGVSLDDLLNQGKEKLQYLWKQLN